MNLFVRSLMSNSILCINVEPDATLRDVADELARHIPNLPKDDVLFIFRCRQLEHDRTLLDYSIQKDCIISMALMIRGG